MKRDYGARMGTSFSLGLTLLALFVFLSRALPLRDDTVSYSLQKPSETAAGAATLVDSSTMTTETHSHPANFTWSICNLLRGPYNISHFLTEKNLLAA
ncbi:MAG: hypothetical protein WD490_01625 [Opitutales bacterium]